MFGFQNKKNTKTENTSNVQGKKKTAVKVQTRIPRNVQESIPYRSVRPNGIIEDLDGWFSKSYRIEDANFSTESEEKRQAMFLDWEKVLNSLTPGMRGQLTIFNRSIDADTVRNNILMKPKDDGKNDLRDEWNDIFLEKMQQGRNNLRKDKFFTVSVKADDIVSANDMFKDIDQNMDLNIRRINKVSTPPMSIEERLSVLYDIYNYNNEFPFDLRVAPVMRGDKIDFPLLSKSGISSKELIAPDSMNFMAREFEIGDAQCAAFFIDRLPTTLSTDIFNNISNISCNMLLNATYIPVKQEAAVKMIRFQRTAVNAQIATLQKENQGLNYIPSELEAARDQAKELMTDIMSRDQKIFKVTLLVVLYAKDRDELNQYTQNLRSTLTSHLCQMRKMTGQEELAFNTCLPLGEMQVSLDRVLTTEAASVFMPFTVQELYQADGAYYGINAISKNMIRYNRKKASNANGLILGKSGSGKSFITKEEIMQQFLNSDDRIIIIDPEGEYTKLGEALGGSIINIDTSGKNSINPLDMDMQYGGDGENPISMKSDYIIGLIEAMVGGEGILSPVDKNIIQRVTRQIYRPYFNYMKSQIERGITCDVEAMPTLADFYEKLTKQPEPSAQLLAAAIENYCVGDYNVFAHRTNVDRDNRLIIYNVQNMSAGLKELAMQVCMNDTWNHTIDNGKKGYYTDIYIDEFHLFTKTRTSASFMKNIYKRARKWHGVPTAITQNIGDLLVNDEAAAIVNNCDFILMMNQSPMDRSALANMYNISPVLQEYITDRGFGIGLIYNGKTIIPFENLISNRDSKSFKMMESQVTSGAKG